MLSKVGEFINSHQYSEIYLYFIIRIPLFFIPISFNEYYINYIFSQFFFNNDLPYCDFLKPEYYVEEFGLVFVPVLYYYYIWVIAIISFNNIVIMSYVTKAIWMMFDFFVFFTLRSFILEHQGQTLSKIGSFLYSVSPTSYLLSAILGTEEALVLASIFISVFYFYKQRYFLSALILSFGFALKIFPIILLLVYIPYLLQNREYKICILFICTLLLTYLVLCIPYIIACPDSLINAQISMIKRPSGIGFFPLEVENILSISIFTLPILLIEITIKNILSLIILTLLAARIMTIKIEKENFLDHIILILSISPLMFWILHYRFIYYLTPFLLIKILKPENIRINKLLSKIPNINSMHIIFGFGFMIFYYTEFFQISSINEGAVQYQWYFIIFGIYTLLWLGLNLTFNMFNSEVFYWYYYPVSFYSLAFYFAVFTIIGYAFSIFNMIGILFYILGIILLYKPLSKEYSGCTKFRLFNYFKWGN